MGEPMDWETVLKRLTEGVRERLAALEELLVGATALHTLLRTHLISS